MKALIINSSPQKNGNSQILCNQFAQGAAEQAYKAGKQV